MQTASKFWHNYVQLAGVPTEIYGLDALNRTSPALRIVVYPGNPGNAAFYLPYMEALHRGLAGEAEVVGVSNLGQCRDGLASGQVPNHEWQSMLHFADDGRCTGIRLCQRLCQSCMILDC